MIDAREFRDTLATFATGVTIVTTTNADGESVGMTASSFNSVSMDPPLILWSVTKAAHSAPAFKDAKYFAIHVLSSEQIEISNKFAKSGTDKFGDTQHCLDSNNVPIIPECTSRFDCKQYAVHDGGDHWIILGEVMSVESSTREGLVFSGGSYATASLIQQRRATIAEQTVDAPIESVLFYQLSRAYHQVSMQFHSKVREAGLTLPEWRILASLSGHEVRRTVSDLSKRTFIHPIALVDMLASLENEGLCIQNGTAQNAIVEGTEKGQDIIAHLFELDSQLEQGIFGGVKTSEAKKLFTLLREVIDQTN
jgi:3-hydroxy-9,10-secoandrosta-1,3,5(10)-triene-9,17-dione monooxygenase reductase component